MFETIRNAFKIKEVRRKIFMTILFIVLFRIGCYITVPGLNDISSQMAAAAETNGGMDIFGLFNAITGSALSQGTLFSLGISPYINASIIVQLLTVAIPALERMSKEGEEGREKINKITRWVTLALAIVSAVGVYLTLSRNEDYTYVNYSWFGGEGTPFYDFFANTAGGKWVMGIYVVIMLVGGSMLVMWIGERITEYGVSNGISMIIFVGIISTAAQHLFTAIRGGIDGNANNWAIVAIFVVGMILVFGFIVWVDGAERKIKVQYAKQVKGNKMYGGQSTFIPIKVNASGVMPLIFAYALLSFPSMLIQTFWADTNFAIWWTKYMTSNGGPVGVVVYNVALAILIFVFAYFYSQIQFNPVEISRNIQNNGGFVTGIRPGRETAEYLAKVVSRITLWGAVFLAIIAFVPSILFSIPEWAQMGTSLQLVNSMSATGMLICVSVALEFNKALENQILMRHYKGLLGSNSKGFLR